ncbi:hypothetical protein EFV37_32565 [Mesorhizobium loti]|uniref:hypothetical protein n=1 Tax=Mesorhizobium TaxID=68287 RepID=UPI000367493E|nr:MULTISPECIES: hypothetical protein [Mesorhizobium]ANN60841.1 hypothetical protein A9174_31860 [Mesorhizobium loti NZP2037]OBP75132.1 hypothetical protein BAE41_31255 [Mesorhizobium loti]OBP92711.1 hypothetical protein BAE38_31250 [Mesorhizobium loti]OBQ73270.1 hypothetical protein A9K72_31795 [Mesorhizobium loti]QKC66428.1 hypothetical protein EB229_32555 [Mesorhizobium jarvisii]
MPESTATNAASYTTPRDTILRLRMSKRIAHPGMRIAGGVAQALVLVGVCISLIVSSHFTRW